MNVHGKVFLKTNIYNYDIINWWYSICRTEISRDFVFSNIEFKNLSRSEVDYYDFKTLNDVIANAKLSSY